MAYTGSTELISGIVQKNGGSFPLVDASAVRVTDDTMLDDELENRPPVEVVTELPESPVTGTLYLVVET